MSSRIAITGPTGSFSDNLRRLKKALAEAETLVVGAGAGLSASAGFAYTGQRLEKYFGDFAAKYGFTDMYTGGFTAFSSPEEQWAFWSRYIYINRYMDPPRPVYEQLLELVRDRDYFVLTTNVDHCFQKAGFDRERLFYTQGDYGLWQCSVPCHQKTYDNGETVREMLEAQGYVFGPAGELTLPEGASPKMEVPTALLPRCPVCGEPMRMNLRGDDRFVEDEGWHAAAGRYTQFLTQRRDSRTLFLELGCGFNSPGVVKFSFWQMAARWPRAVFACVNYGEACAPVELREKSICLDGDIGGTLASLRG